MNRARVLQVLQVVDDVGGLLDHVGKNTLISNKSESIEAEALSHAGVDVGDRNTI